MNKTISTHCAHMTNIYPEINDPPPKTKKKKVVGSFAEDCFVGENLLLAERILRHRISHEQISITYVCRYVGGLCGHIFSQRSYCFNDPSPG